MDYAVLLSQFLGYIVQYGWAGKYIIAPLAFIGSLTSVITAFVAVWHSLVQFLLAISKIHGLEFVSAIASIFQTQEANINFGANKVLALIAQLSAIPLPKLPKV